MTKPPDRLWLVALAIPAAAALLLMRPDQPAGVSPPPLPILADDSTAAAPVTARALAAAPSPSTHGLRLHGLLGAGAIFALPDGRQKWVASGREVVPGLRLEAVQQNAAILVSGADRIRLTFGDVPAQRLSEQTSRTSAPGQGDDRLHEERLRYRLGFEPRRVDGRIAGFAIRRGAEVPLLRRAGLQPGDVLVAVNGQSFDSEEKVDELASEIAGSFEAEFEFERNGRRMRLTVGINARD